MTINHSKLLDLLKEKQYTQGQIAKNCSCSISTVRRIARKHNLLPGQGRIRFWTAPSPSPELAYILGMFVTDGNLGFEYKTRKPKQVIITTITKEIYKKLLLCYSIINIPAKLNGPYNRDKDKFRDQFAVAVYWSEFAQWMLDTTDSKNRIPDFVLDAPKSHQIEFLSGVIDGDGTVGKYGRMNVRGTKKWLSDLPKMLSDLQIRTTGYRPYGKTLSSGNTYYIVTIRRKDFIAISPKCVHPIKVKRMFSPEIRKRKKRKRVYINCPACNIKRMNKNSKRCNDCHRKSDDQQQHLQSIAKKGNRAGNITRWGTGHLNKH